MERGRKVTIVTYHYVRPIQGSAYPAIKGLELERFKTQVDYLAANYNLIAPDDLLCDLPPRAALLTFDDGYSDHYENVWPILRSRRLKGVFAPVVDACRNHRVLDVHKVQFILACAGDVDKLVAEVDEFMASSPPPHLSSWRSGPEYRRSMVKRRFDTLEVSFIKDMLQRELPYEQRTELTGRLFARYVSADEADFAGGLYASTEQLREMRDEGQSFAVHGVTHRWLNSLGYEEQESEISASLDFLQGLGAGRIFISYPFGAYNDDTLKISAGLGIRAGFTTRPRVADLAADPLLTLPRLDTNDLRR